MTIKDIQKLSEKQSQISTSPNFRVGKSAIHSPTVSQKEIASEANASILIGSSTANMEDKGKQNSSTITLIAGIGTAIKNSQVSPDSKVELSPKHYYDSAVISICEQTDPDYNWGSSGWLNTDIESNNSSAIVLKADELRFFSRGGIKLVTRVDQQKKDLIIDDPKAPQHPKRDPTGIWLISNDEENSNSGFPQPMVKGDNLIDFLNKTLNELNKIHGLINKLFEAQDQINQCIRDHTHMSDFTAAPLLRDLDPPTIAKLEANSAIINDLSVKKIYTRYVTNIENLRKNYLRDSAPNTTYINSRYNRTN
jgi:hypothetical protein